MKRIYLVLLCTLMFVSLATASSDRSIRVAPISPTGKMVSGNQWLMVIGANNHLKWPPLKTAVNSSRSLGQRPDALITISWKESSACS